MNKEVSELENRTIEFRRKDHRGRNIPVGTMTGSLLQTTEPIMKIVISIGTEIHQGVEIKTRV